MKPQNATLSLLFLISLGLAACSGEERTRPPSVRVTVVNTAPSQPELNFKRVQRVEGALDYKATGTFSWDSDTYTFNVDAVSLDGSTAPVLSFVKELVPGTEYTILLTEVDVAGQIEVQEWILESPTATIAATDTVITPAHAAPSLGQVDVYLEAPGADLAAANPLGTLNFMESLPPVTGTSGDVEFSITDAGLPGNVRLRSTAFGLPGGSPVTFAILDGANEGLAPFYVLAVGGTSVLLSDQDLQAGLRAINTSTDREALEVALDSDFAPALLPGVAFGTMTDYALFTAGERNLTVTPTSNPGGALEIDEPFVSIPGQIGTWLIAGDPGSLSATFTLDDRRAIAGESKLALYNGAFLFTGVNVYIVAPGTDLDTVLPTASLPQRASLSATRFLAGDYELTVRDSVAQNVLAGPTAITLAAEGYYGILVTDSVGGATADIALVDDFPAGL